MTEWQNRAYGPHMAIHGGYIIQPGESDYRHRVGGDSWKAIDPINGHEQPALLLTLDLKDPRLASIPAMDIDELPLASHVNCNWYEKLTFQIEPDTRTVRLLDPPEEPQESAPEKYRLPNPLPETKVTLRAMSPFDWPTDEDAYYRIIGEFLGGTAFFRVMGPPIWVQRPQRVICQCGKPMCYVCSIGYESAKVGSSQQSGYFGDRRCFLGDGATYFFLCASCGQVVVKAQYT